MEPEEKQQIINEVIEQVLLRLPEVVGNLITNQIAMTKLNREFYLKFPEFAANKSLVASVVEQIEGENPGSDYQEILTKATPVIKNRLGVVKSLDTKSVSVPTRKLPSLSGNGDL